MASADIQNANPTILSVSQLPTRLEGRISANKGAHCEYDNVVFRDRDWLKDLMKEHAGDDSAGEPLDEQEVYDLISVISDPEHPHTLGELNVVRLPDIHVTPPPRNNPKGLGNVQVELTPTINHCSLATVIGLAVRVRLEQTLPPNYRIDVRMKDGSHAQDDQVNKQLGDKERVAAALENDSLKGVLDNMMKPCFA
ncbi:protein AE7 [Echria macrotheca]|uniref:Protein AE7 n=1 Tax=Echria macrotheca TaxID=438768 RepID=A0AAJ0BHR7_9PEZI|nr:protein AE7 [Echria macrotheca]